jgi:hypothetical protein
MYLAAGVYLSEGPNLLDTHIHSCTPPPSPFQFQLLHAKSQITIIGSIKLEPVFL